LKLSFPQANDELYANLRWQPAASYHVLATANDDHALYAASRTDSRAPQPRVGPSANEPMLWTVDYGKGRVFVTALGHDVEQVQTVAFGTTFARGAEWAATGKVTQPIPPAMASGPASAAAAPPTPEGYVPRGTRPGKGLAPGMTVTDLGTGGRTYRIHMVKGDEIMSGLTDFAEKYKIKNGHFTALGAINKGLFALASYNAGPGRISGLRRKAKAMGLDENKWFQNVEIVASREIGRETVQYVGNIYKYYVAYRLVLEQNRTRDQAREDSLKGP